MNNLPVADLNFSGIKQSLQDFLKQDPNYKDWNFDASGISTLLNVLAYNTHYIGYYVKMLLDESFVDSAHTREALLSIAKRNGYVPKGKRAARADIKLTLNIPIAQDPPSRNIHITAGQTFSGSNNTSDKRIYNLNDDVIMYDRTDDGVTVTYTSPEVTIYEGSYETYRFVVDSEEVNQRFIIRDRDLDITTLKVEVIDNLDVQYFQQVDDIFELNSESKVFFVTTNEDGYYQVFFGNGVFGVSPPNGSTIKCDYISTHGESGNGAKKFLFNLDTNEFGPSPTFTVETVSVASGGMEEESIESLRFTIPHHHRRQQRILTESDYRAVILSEFRNIESMNVWGGERNGQREYGKVFISIKPKFTDSLTSSARNEIRDSVLKKYGTIGTDVEFVDPQFIDVDVDVYGVVDLRKTNDSLRTLEGRLIDKLELYDESVLNRFDTILSDVDMLNFIRDPSVTTLYSNKTLRKSQKILHKSTSPNRVEFSNPILPGVYSNTIRYSNSDYILKDIDGVIWLSEVGGTNNFTAGTINYDAGTLEFILPLFATIKGFETLFAGIIEFTAKPKTPNISTSLNNIVRISKTTVSLRT